MDYSNKDLQGCSFKGQNLEGKKFLNTDITGVDFTDAQLQNADFSGAHAGIPKHWIAMLVIASWLMLGISMIFTGLSSFLILNILSEYKSIGIPIFLALYIGLFFVAIRLDFLIGLAFIGFPAALGIVITVIAGLIFLYTQNVGNEIIYPAISFIMAYSVAGGVTFGGIIIGSIGVAISTAAVSTKNKNVIVTKLVIVATTVLVVRVTIPIAEGAFNINGAEPGIGAHIFASIITLTVTLLGAHIGWRDLEACKKNAWIRSLAIAFTSIKGTSFRGANLADADFTGATLKSTDFRKAILTRINFHKAHGLDLARFGERYLQNSKVRQFLITGEGEKGNFDRQDFRGVNLKEAKLAGASFIDADLSQANLQGADLFEAKLVQTNLDQANLSNARLTGAYIEDWGITRRTRLDGVKCKYIYLKLPTEGDRDPNRMPPSEQGEFGENDFNIFITSVLDTLDLYHKDNINAGLAITILKSLTEDYPVKFELVGLDKRGDNQFVLRLKVFGQTSYFQLQREYYARYVQTLPLYDPKKLITGTDRVDELIQTIEEKPGTHIGNFHDQGIVIAGGNVIMNVGRNIHMGDGNYNESIEGNYVEGNYYATGENQKLVEAAAEIQTLLKQLEKSYPIDTTMDKMTLATEAISQIEKNRDLTARILSSLQVGSVKAFEQILNHPAASFVIGALEDWQQTKRDL